jgi:hypothetical protein
MPTANAAPVARLATLAASNATPTPPTMLLIAAITLVHSRLVNVGGHVHAVDPPGAVAGPDGAGGQLPGRRRLDRAQQLDLAVVQPIRVEPARRLHRGQADQLQQVVLNHVAQRTGVVVVAGAAFQGDRLVPDDLDPLNMAGVPDRLEDAVGEPQPEQVLDSLQAQEVVGAEGRLLAEAPGQQLVERLRLGQAAPERLLDHHPAALWQPDRGQRPDRGGERRRRQRQVSDHGPLGLVERPGQSGRIAGVGPLVAGHGDQGIPRRRVHRRRVAFEPIGHVAAEGGGVPVVAGHADNGERLGQAVGLVEMGEAGSR